MPYWKIVYKESGDKVKKEDKINAVSEFEARNLFRKIHRNISIVSVKKVAGT